jgi:predicted MFS family arabinose efflux permease
MVNQNADSNLADAQSAVTPSAWGARTVLILLTLIATVQFFDRALMVVILEPLKQEFSLTDAQLGFLSGFSYAAAFALAGIPFGWMADRGNRRNLLAALLAIWSALVAFAGSANSFMALVLTRVGIGAADAGGQPCSVSIISDLYPTQRRASAVAIFFVGVPLGMASGFIVGAIVAGQLGWRTAFYVAAAPGVLLTILLLLLVKEPKRGASDGLQASKDNAPPLAETFAFMRSQKSLVYLMAASVLVTASSSAMMSWIGSLLVRVHGLSLENVGLLTGLCMGGFGAIGTLVFGWVADRQGAKDMRNQPRMMAIAAAVIAISGTAVSLLPTVLGAAISLALFASMVAGLNGPTYALTQSLVKVRMRGTSMSTLVVLLNLIGVGVGPALAGILSDQFAAAFGAESVRWAMVCVLLMNIPAVVLFVRCAHTIQDDLQRAQA